ncbi:site-specific DNA-methyltransferase [Ruegeria sp. HKCCD9179]|uniref:site-specific DNA-methyltransferase n=1 Tax=Ruegeria sp. HKCCD9179 TaxID=2683016 RepID=UPI001488A51A|nr:site-specific DNA-methyltransferase [Ruegeria sp. HKCCD9179]
MPTLDWIGKKAVVNHHREVPYRLVHCNGERSAGDPDAGNLLVQGDNLEALKALLPYYAGKVKCIYIDPPYNTGNEGWVYNDNVASPEIKAWLGKVVGKEAEDLSRHDKWLCMMYPRLRLLRDFMREDGVLFVSIDDDEAHSLRMLLNEIFGISAYIGTFVWKRRTGSMDETGNFSRDHDYVIAYQRGNEGLTGDERTFAKYDNPDNDPRGDWISDNLSASKPGGDTYYAISDPDTGREFWPPKGRYWPYNPETMKEKIADGRILFPGEDGDTPMVKRFKKEAKSLFQPVSSWIGQPKDKDFLDDEGVLHLSTAMNSAATKNLKDIFGDKVFNYSKPADLVRKLIAQAAGPNDIILDSFAGSGTTGQAVFELNKEDGGNRQFILVEMDELIAPQITAERLSRVIKGYDKKGDPEKPVEGLGGGFRYCHLGTPLFNEFGDIDEAVIFPDLAAHVFFSETGAPLPKKVDASNPLIGQHKDKIVYLLFSPAEQGFPREAAGNVLTPDALADLPAAPDDFEGERVVYAEGCTVSPERLKVERVVFKQIPYQIEGQ